MADPKWNPPHLKHAAAIDFHNRAQIALHSPAWERDYERAVEAANVPLTDPALVAEAEEIGRLDETPDGRRILTNRLIAKALRNATAAARKVNHLRNGKVVPNPDTKSVQAALEFIAELKGCKAPTQVEISGDLSRLSDDELEARYRALVAANDNTGAK